jgi:glucose/arabinose dehydrogenase
MFIRFQIVLLFLTLRLVAQQGDEAGQAMNPVVPGSQIPASPVLSVEDSLNSFQLPAGFVIEPVAAEPLIDKPVCLDFDSKGRMWICEMRDYMPDIDGKGESVADGRLVILEDTDHDGRFDKRSVFLDKLHLPRALAVFEDGLLFIDEHRLCWVKRAGDVAVGGWGMQTRRRGRAASGERFFALQEESVHR